MGRAVKLPPVSEGEFQAQVIEAAQRANWRVAHFRRVRVQRANGSVYYETPVAADGKGFPDLLLIRETWQGARVIVAELKVGKNKPTPEQMAWLGAFEASGVPAYTWFPSDWPEIRAVLTGAG